MDFGETIKKGEGDKIHAKKNILATLFNNVLAI